MSEAQRIEPAFRDRPAVDGDSVMALVEGKARVPDQAAGNDDLADFAADVRDRRGAMHDPTQNVNFVQVIVFGGNVGYDVRQAQAGPVQTGECGFQRRPVGNAEKFVGVEGMMKSQELSSESVCKELHCQRNLFSTFSSKSFFPTVSNPKSPARAQTRSRQCSPTTNSEPRSGRAVKN